MSGTVGIFVETLSVFDPAKARALNQELRAEGGGIEVYALVYPDYAPPIANRPAENRALFREWSAAAQVPVWGWLNAGPDQAGDVAAMTAIDRDLGPRGWVLDIEGQWTIGANLRTLADGCAALGRPRRASLAGTSASHVALDFRSLDLEGFEIDWQAYLDSGEGPPPATAVAELYQSSFVIQGWEYRHRIGPKYGWGKVVAANDEIAYFDSYLNPGKKNAVFGTLPREWGWWVDDRILWPLDPSLPPSGLLMGRAAYPRIRFTLDLTRGYAQKRSLSQWTALAATGRIPGAQKRPASVYTASEIPPIDVIRAIARGAG